MSNSETMKFDAEVGKILQLMIHSLYTNKDIFLRELISNASDACDKLRYMAITDPSLVQEDPEFKIKISVDEKNRTIIIKDNGIGMNRQELIENLGTIARSGTQNFVNQLTGDKKADVQLIGQFGVGFYSGFMVADEMTVISRKADDAQGHIWKSKGTGEFTITPVDGKVERGTTIHLHLKETEDEYLDRFRIRHIVTTYSDHISIPIEFIDAEEQAEVLNKASALWMRSKSEINDEQYLEFYRHVSHSADEPWMIMHNRNEGLVEYTNLLFIPSKKPFDLFHPDRKARVKLYVKRVFITDEGVNLVPAWLRFLRGVIDSEDLPLNISRETLQHNNVIEKIKKSVIKKVIAELKKKLEQDLVGYKEFWENFGAVVKEGLCEGIENRENLLETCLFKSALTGEMITLDDYIAKMKDNQTEIYYYLSEEASEVATANPQLEGFIKRGVDVLLFNDKVDDFWVNVEHQFKDKALKSVTRSGIELDKMSGNEEKTEEEQLQDNIVLDYFKKVLGNLVQDAKTSYKLVDSPVCLASSEGGMDIKMERFLLEQKQLASASAKIIEVNQQHPIIKKIASDLASNNDGNENTQELIKMLYDQACIIEGEPVKDTSAFSKRLNLFIQKAIIS
jgi:molecular chaperone HtpG